MNRTAFFAAVRTSLFAGRLSQEQVSGTEAVINAFEAAGLKDIHWLAYMLATAFHETAKTMQPVRETLADTDDEAISILDNAFRKGRLSWVKTPYWRKDADGHSWLGRGDVQLTHRENYAKAEKELGVPLTANPDLAMQPDVAADIMIKGMTEGWFTGKKLSDYFHDQTADWVNARKIINGLDRANDIAGYGKKFLSAIEAAA